jgi:hypothetical protein
MSQDHETIEQTIAYKLGMMAAFKMVLEALSSRAMAHNHTPNLAHATECLLIANEVIKPMWMDASREASGLHVAALEKRA